MIGSLPAMCQFRTRGYVISALLITLLIILAHPAYSLTQEENLSTYDDEFFSIKYPSSWHISSEPWNAGMLGDSVVFLDNNQMNMNQTNRITPRSSMEHSVIGVVVVPRSSLPSSNDMSPSELVNSFVDYFFSREALSESGAELITDNYTSLSGIQARTVTYTEGGYYNLVINIADESNMYQISYNGQESRYQKELHEVESIISSFKIKGTSDTSILSTI